MRDARPGNEGVRHHHRWFLPAAGAALFVVAGACSSSADPTASIAAPNKLKAGATSTTGTAASTTRSPSTTSSSTTSSLLKATTSSSPGQTATIPRSITTTPAPASTTTSPKIVHPSGHRLQGAVITIDPGHNGANAQHTSQINKLVDIGNGFKACNTVGTTTNDGYPEHAFNWDVAMRVVAKLRARGATVVLTHPTDTGWGPCSVDRAAIANRAHSAAAVSIHADGGPSGGRGFHVIEPSRLPGLTDDIFAASSQLGSSVRDAVRSGTAMPTSTYAGRQGVVTSGAYGGLNRADVPAIFIECGNMRNATDAAMLKSATFREQLATAIVDGLARFLS